MKFKDKQGNDCAISTEMPLEDAQNLLEAVIDLTEPKATLTIDMPADWEWCGEDIQYLANCTVENECERIHLKNYEMAQRRHDFVERERHPDCPLVLVETCKWTFVCTDGDGFPYFRPCRDDKFIRLREYYEYCSYCGHKIEVIGYKV